MSGIRKCIRCGRTIDAHARICPYCNWDQTQPVPAQQPAEQAAANPTYVAPLDRSWRNPALATAGVVLVILVAALGLAARLRNTGPSAASLSVPQEEQQKLLEKEQAASAKGEVKPRPQANVMLVPDNGPAPNGEQPVTSAPNTSTAEGLPNEYQRTDATAASSAEYSQMAQRAKAEKKTLNALVDPRSLSGAAYEQGGDPRRRSAAPRPRPIPTAAVTRIAGTPPVPEYQPVPSIRVSHSSTVRLDLSIGADGRVKNVRVSQPVEEMGKLIGSVQSWKFRPATENGVPVPSQFSVELSFNAGNE
jgi:hypothetical protein